MRAQSQREANTAVAIPAACSWCTNSTVDSNTRTPSASMSAHNCAVRFTSAHTVPSA